MFRLSLCVILFFVANFFYAKFMFARDVKKYSPLKPVLDSVYKTADIIYLGESSNTSFNPWTDTLSQSIADFIQGYMPFKKVGSISHESFHLGLFRKILVLYPRDSQKTIIVTLNIRAMSPPSVFSGTEARNQQEALFYSDRLPLLTRIFLSLHYYDNANASEREREKMRTWRTRSIKLGQGSWETARDWMYANNKFNDKHPVPTKLRDMSDAYIKEFGFLLDAHNPRVQDLRAMIAFAKANHIPILFHILPENLEYARALWGQQLVQYLEYNHGYLLHMLQKENMEYVDNFAIARGVDFTDQWYPTEHFNTRIRRLIALSLAQKLNPAGPFPNLHYMKNNYPNMSITFPVADTLLRQWQEIHR